MARVGACASNDAMESVVSLLQKNVLNDQPRQAGEQLRLGRPEHGECLRQMRGLQRLQPPGVSSSSGILTGPAEPAAWHVPRRLVPPRATCRGRRTPAADRVLDRRRLRLTSAWTATTECRP